MSSLQVFDYSGQNVRTVSIDGGPWFVVADVCKALGLSNPTMASSSLEEDDLSTAEVIDSMGRKQNATITNESGTYQLIFQSRKPAARAFKRWVTHEVLPAIRQTGSYAVESKSELDIIRDQHKSITLLLDRAEELEGRAAVAEARVDLIERGSGFSIREFHKHYFSDTPEREFNELLYKRKLLIDQRGSRGRDERGRLKNGREHRHPSYQGKQFFFLDPSIDHVTGERYYQTKVRPGTPEVELVHYLEARGLTSNRNATITLPKEITA